MSKGSKDPLGAAVRVSVLEFVAEFCSCSVRQTRVWLSDRIGELQKADGWLTIYLLEEWPLENELCNYTEDTRRVIPSSNRKVKSL